MTKPQNIRIEEYDYPLPDERIAKHPLPVRDACKLLVYNRNPGTDRAIEDCLFNQLPELLPHNTLLVYNNTRVINARLRFRKESGAMIEIFCLEPIFPTDYEQCFAATVSCEWKCLVGNSKRWKSGELIGRVSLPSGVDVKLVAERLEKNIDEKSGQASSVIRFSWDNTSVSFSDIISAAGEIPIPPYLNRSSEACDAVDYQTIYSHIEGSVAAPTAGLHFTPEVFKAIDARGDIQRAEVTLHVGAGTFRPVKADMIGDHDMHSEFIAIESSFISALINSISGGCPIVAVGTTSVRTIESLYHIGTMIIDGSWCGELPQWQPYESSRETSVIDALNAILEYLTQRKLTTLIARTRIIIAPGYDYKIVNAMITNFHQPQSTLLLLVSAFIGDTWRNLYHYALERDYRFLSYGDACLFFRKK